jgi:hypothetical protein
MWSAVVDGLDDRSLTTLDRMVARLYVDTLVFDEAHLPLLLLRFGPDHVLLGSDHPFVPFGPAVAPLRSRSDLRAAYHDNAVTFLRGEGPENP